MGKIRKGDRRFFVGQRWVSTASGRVVEIDQLLDSAAVCVVIESPGNPREEGSLTHVFFPEFSELLLKGEGDGFTVERPEA
jgi:hypothetical protein